MKRYSYHSLLRPSFEQSLTVPYLVRSINQIQRTTWRRLPVNIGLDKQWYAYPFSVKELPNFLWNSSLLCNWSSPSLDTTPRLLSLRKFTTIYISGTHQEWKKKNSLTRQKILTSLFQLVIEVMIIRMTVCRQMPPIMPDQMPCNKPAKFEIFTRMRHSALQSRNFYNSVTIAMDAVFAG